MYIHLGRDYVLNDRDIIGIFNLETTTVSPRSPEHSHPLSMPRRMGPWSAFRMTCPSVMFWPMPLWTPFIFRSCPARP